MCISALPVVAYVGLYVHYSISAVSAQLIAQLVKKWRYWGRAGGGDRPPG